MLQRFGMGFVSDIGLGPRVGAHFGSTFLSAKQMSFWATSPGPTWWDCIESLNPCRPRSYGICLPTIGLHPETRIPPPGIQLLRLAPRHAQQIEVFLKQQFTIYPRCRISLSADQIRTGLSEGEWIGVGLFTKDRQLVGCCFSKPLGRLKFSHEMLDQGGVVDYFCVHREFRQKGLARTLLKELVALTAQVNRLVHIFLKEGFPLWSLPPLYTSQYISRRKRVPGEERFSLGSMGIALQTPIKEYTHAEYFPLQNVVGNLPWKLSGESELFGFNYKGHDVFLCLTDLHHVTVPEGDRIGELSWMLPKTIEVPLSIQKLAVEACVDCSSFDIVLMDKQIPHESKKGWQKDATFSWYLFNYSPGGFFNIKPYWIF